MAIEMISGKHQINNLLEKHRISEKMKMSMILLETKKTNR